jgi:hypothetical protein
MHRTLITDDKLSGTADFRGGDAPLPVGGVEVLPRDNLEQHAFVTARVPDTNLVSDLQAAQGQFTG